MKLADPSQVMCTPFAIVLNIQAHLHGHFCKKLKIIVTLKIGIQSPPKKTPKRHCSSTDCLKRHTSSIPPSRQYSH